MWGVQRNQSKFAVVCLDFASVLLVEPSPVASLPSFIKVGRGAVIHGIAFQRDSALGLLNCWNNRGFVKFHSHV